MDFRAEYVRMLISGRVQGVYMRAWLQQMALSRGLTGWARNLADGRVEAVLGGAAPVLDESLPLIREGPPAAQVEGIEKRPATDAEITLIPREGFAILPDA